jgi:hypothetical protein
MQACQPFRDGYIEVAHGDEEAIRPLVNGANLAELAGDELVTLGGSGHAPKSVIRLGATCSCATSPGGATHDRHTETARADARPLSRPRGLRRA